MDDLAALRLQIEWGADEALEEAPVNRLRPTAPSPQPPDQVRGRFPPAQPEREIGGRNAPSPAVREIGVKVPGSLEELRAAIASFEGCALRDTASHLVFAQGNPAASLLLIGDPPGTDEDRSGLPFAGPAGDYLDRMLASINLHRENLLLTPLIPWRPPGDRPPNPPELVACLPFLHQLIALAKPRRLLLLGPLAARSLLPQTASRRRQRGSWIDVSVPGLPHPVPALPTFSPAELMRSPKDRRAAWADLRLLRRTLDADAASA